MAANGRRDLIRRLKVKQYELILVKLNIWRTA